MVFHTVAPKLDPQAIKGLRTQAPLLNLSHVLQERLHLFRLISVPLAPQEFRVGHTILPTNHQNLILALDQHDPARHNRILAAPEYVTL